MAFGNIYGQGGSSLISRLLGQNNLEGTKRVSSFCFYIAIANGVVLAILMMAFCSPLLTLLGTDSDTFSHARNYYSVLAICAPIVVLSFIHSNLVRCEGLASQSMIGSALGTVINIILDPIFIFGFNMGVRGAAIATVLSQALSAIWALRFLCGKKYRSPHQKEKFKNQGIHLPALYGAWNRSFCNAGNRKCARALL